MDLYSVPHMPESARVDDFRRDDLKRILICHSRLSPAAYGLLLCYLGGVCWAIIPTGSSFHLIFLLGVPYAIKTLLRAWAAPAGIATCTYSATVCVILIYIYCGTDWHSTDARWEFSAYMVPIIFLTIPTSTFVYDIDRPERATMRSFVIRSTIEVLVVFPIWYILCIAFAIFGLNWVSI